MDNEGVPEEPKPPKRALKRSRIDEEAWLVKVPSWVAEKWSEQERGTVLGEVMMEEQKGGRPPKFKGKLNSNITGSDAPTEFSLGSFPLPPSQYIISDDLAGNVEIEASVKYSLNLIPTNVAAATRLAGVRISQVDINNKDPIRILDVGDIKRFRPHSMRNELVSNKKDTTKTGRLMTRAKIAEDKLIPILFQLFEQQENWGFGQLNEQVNQPQDHLKKILEKLCIYVTAGVNKATWEIRPEYRNSAKLRKTDGDTDVSDSKPAV